MFPQSVGEAMKMIATPARWIEIVTSFAKNFWDLGVWWAHPLLLLAVLGFCLRFITKDEIRARLWILIPIAGLLAADFGIYLISPTGLGWQLSTSNNRLIVQVWPALLFAFFLTLKAPAAAPVIAPAPKVKKKQAYR